MRAILSAKIGGSVTGSLIGMSVSELDSIRSYKRTGTNDDFGRFVDLLITSEHVANGVAYCELRLEIRAVEYIVNTMQVASREDSVL